MVAVSITSVTDNARDRCVTGGSSAHPIGSTSAVLHERRPLPHIFQQAGHFNYCDQTTDHVVSFDPQMTGYFSCPLRVKRSLGNRSPASFAAAHEQLAVRPMRLQRAGR